MKAKLQVDHLKKGVDELQKLHGNPKLNAIYGGGCIRKPKILFLFMNPTAKNISSSPNWKGLRAPWIGTKNIWKLLNSLDIINDLIFEKIQSDSNNIWTCDFAFSVYDELNKKSIYVTNLAKCTQDDARALKDKVFKDYLENTLAEIYAINPLKIISFGNQVSSILLNKKIQVSNYKDNEKEVLKLKNKVFDVFPVYYPVGQGMRNIDKAISRISSIIDY
jgi:DNA polymerase